MNDHAALSVYGRRAVELPCRDNGEDGEATLWVGIVAWDEFAESLALHVTGDMVSASGRLQITRYTNRDGEAKEQLDILADGLVSARTIRPSRVQKRKRATPPASPPDPLPFQAAPRTEPEPVPASRRNIIEGPITDDDIPF